MSLSNAVLDGNRLALARLLTQVENGTETGWAELSSLFPHTGRAHLVGVTGAPGTGKSTLVNQLARYFRLPTDGNDSRSVGIVAVDPSSPFSGGAIMGDRIRMRDLAGDPGVFIRSMATRGSLGGLARATAGVVQVLDAAGYDVILIETVGAGQAEVDIARLAHTTIVVEAPGLGDDIQAIKAGILEIADILVVNKADRQGVENTVRALRNMLKLAHPVSKVFKIPGREEDLDAVQTQSASQTWSPPVVTTIATEGDGIPEVCSMIDEHHIYLQESGNWELKERARLASELQNLLHDCLMETWRDTIDEDLHKNVMEQVFARKLSPQHAVKKLIQR